MCKSKLHKKDQGTFFAATSSSVLSWLQFFSFFLSLFFSTKKSTLIRLHLPHAEGGFGVTFNDVTKDAAFYTTTSRFVAWLGAFPQERQQLWLSMTVRRRSVRSLNHRLT
jgi:hypothetical protein